MSEESSIQVAAGRGGKERWGGGRGVLREVEKQ